MNKQTKLTPSSFEYLISDAFKYELDQRVINILKRNGIKHVYTLALMTEKQIKSIYGIGEKSFIQIAVAMEAVARIPLCKTINESIERFIDKFYDSSFAYYIRKVDGDTVKIFFNKESNSYTFKITNKNNTTLDYMTYNKEAMLIMYNWEEPIWRSSFKCGEFTIQA